MGVGKKNLKGTKKFEKRHLKGVLDKRKEGAKIKQRIQLKEKQKSKRSKDAEYFKGGASEGQAQDGEQQQKTRPNGAARGGKAKKVSEMSVDDFFQNGFENIIDKTAKRGAAKLGKRKRDEPKKEGQDEGDDDDAEIGSDSDVSIGGQPVASDSEDGSEEEDDAMGMSKKAMDDLARKDPEFYKFLKENDPDALDFDENADLAEVDELSAGEDEEEEEEEEDDDDDEKKNAEEKQKKKKKQKKSSEQVAEEPDQGSKLTRGIVAKWRKAMTENKSLRAARQVVLAFRSAAHLNETDENGETDQRWAIDDPEVFNDILVLALKEIPVVMNHHLPVKESAAGKVYVQTETKKFKTLSLLLKSYTSSIMHLLGTLSDDKTLKLTLSSITPILPYLLSFKKLIKALAKSVINFWAQPASSETTRVTAFLVIRRLIVIGDKGVRETVLKATYQGLIQGCRITNHNTLQGINLMKNSAAELWGIDPTVGYTTAFAFIRQLAIHLRNSIVHNQNDSFRMVYNWQFTHSLDFWSCVLAQHCSPLKDAEAGKQSQLWLLIYPLVQVTLGALRLIPTSLYFPLRFHLVRSLLRISRATGTYIPLASSLLEVLNSAEMKKPPKATTLKAFDFSVSYKASKAYLRTRVYQDGIGEQIVELMGEFTLLWATSIAFPELALPIVIQLKRWLKQSRSKSQGNHNGKISSQIILLVQKLEANAKFIQDKRAKVDFAPKDRAQVDAFLKDFDLAKTPLGAYVVGQQKARAEKAKMLEEARKEDERKRKKGEKGADLASDDDAQDSDEEMEVDLDADMDGQSGDEDEQQHDEGDESGDDDDDDE